MGALLVGSARIVCHYIHRCGSNKIKHRELKMDQKKLLAVPVGIGRAI